MKIKTADLTGPALDWAVAKCEGGDLMNFIIQHQQRCYRYSTDWSQGGPIIEREKMVLGYLNGLPCASTFEGHRHQRMEFGPTPLVAAMRCYVASKMGDEVEVPDALT